MSAYKDVAERVVRTFAQAFLAAYGLDLATVMNVSLAQQAALSGAAAVVALAVGLFATRVGSRDNASLL